MRELLWRLCELLPHTVGPAGLGEPGATTAEVGRGGRSGCRMDASHVLQLSGRLSFYLTQLIDAIDCCRTPGQRNPTAHASALTGTAFTAAAASVPAAALAAARASEARLFLQLVACGLSWMRPGDEVLAQGQVSAMLLNPRWVDRAGGAFAVAAAGGVQPTMCCVGGAPAASTRGLPSPAQPSSVPPSAPSEAASSLRPALLPTFIHLLRLSSATAQADAQARVDGRTDTLASLRPSPDRSCLPLPTDWLATPALTYGIDARGTVEEEAMLAQLRAALGWLCACSTAGWGADRTAGEGLGSTAGRGLSSTGGGGLSSPAGGLAPLRWVPRSRLLCRGLQVLALPLSPWRDAAVARALDALLDVWCGGGAGAGSAAGSGGGAGGGGAWRGSDLLGDETETDVMSLVRRVLDLYLAESMGSPTFTAWVLLPLRTAEPLALRLEAFGALDQLSHKLSVAPPHRVGAWAAVAARADVPADAREGVGGPLAPGDRRAPGATGPPIGAAGSDASEAPVATLVPAPPTLHPQPVPPAARTAVSLMAGTSARRPSAPSPDGDRLLELLEESLVRGNLGKAPPSSFLVRWAVHHLWAAAAGGSAPLLAARVEGWREEWLRMADEGIGDGSK